ncbi:response regulator transcription factor [Ornithinimicrobium sp. F0845]|uniref:response regulator transcription factor n=1 Tax=Ornithinimicrobium sp. F0845 TaxID=2926412 RepID=UPI001FF55338|nr:response regulator transcription factor [Ornithinimicrobium sp. F0845]MCK0114178.1 response regulator transcription factor [Ornithinimicrobium sp. F0845]
MTTSDATGVDVAGFDAASSGATGSGTTGSGAAGSGAAASRAARVLVVDDEKALADVVSRYLHRGGYDVTQAHDGLSALQLARALSPDVVVLDLNLPGRDGLDVCRELREFSDCYVVMLTARVEEVDTLRGLSVGADDYVTKPFSPRELVARVDAMLRRPRQRTAAAGEPVEQAPGSQREWGGLVLDLESWQVTVDGKPVELTRTEFDLLDALSSTPGRVLSRPDLIVEVWGDSWVDDERLVDVHIAHLRRKLGDPAGDPRFIRTVRGRGYRFGSVDS